MAHKITRRIQADGEFTADEVRNALLQIVTPEALLVTADIQFAVQIPSGGDYSGMRLSLEDLTVHWSASWTETEEG